MDTLTVDQLYILLVPFNLPLLLYSFTARRAVALFGRWLHSENTFMLVRFSVLWLLLPVSINSGPTTHRTFQELFSPFWHSLKMNSKLRL